MSTKTKQEPNHTRFPKGTSGNPAGRPKGSRNKASLILESMFEGEAEVIARIAIEMAKAKNIHALKLCLERILPPCKDRPVSIDLPPAKNLADISAGMNNITAAVCDGGVTPEQGETIARTLGSHANILVTQDLERRVENLEQGRLTDAHKLRTVKSYT